MNFLFIAGIILSTFHAPAALGELALRYENSNQVNSGEYLLRSHENRNESIFERHQSVDLGVDLGIGADCGKVDFKGTMRGTLKNLLDSKYFGDLGKNIMASSPMLLACYFSPTWCAILKHTQVSANFLSQMRLDQCAIIDKYTDKRVEDYYQQRQTCVRKRIKKNGGNLEAAMQGCGDVYDKSLVDWQTGKSTTNENRLIESSANWAGLKGKDNKRSVDLLKSMVGETIVSKGSVKVNYGSKNQRTTPASHLRDIQKNIHSKLCQKLVTRLVREQKYRGRPPSIGRWELNQLSPSNDGYRVNRQTIESLVLMPNVARGRACRKIADAVALSVFTNDVEKSLHVLQVAMQNPHLPDHRRAELEQKRLILKDSVAMTIALNQSRNEPLNRVLEEVHAYAEKIKDRELSKNLGSGVNRVNSNLVKSQFFDCSDAIMCGGG